MSHALVLNEVNQRKLCGEGTRGQALCEVANKERGLCQGEAF